jgi:hypothetical protein
MARNVIRDKNFLFALETKAFSKRILILNVKTTAENPAT